jgi:urate oxidase
MTLTWNRYGKSRVRLVKVLRRTEPHELVDLTLDVQLEGAFEVVYVDGDNRSCLATDTMKNTVYALARHDPIAQVESFAERLAEHFAAKPAVSRVRISAVEHRW